MSSSLMTPELVREIHDLILSTEPGLKGDYGEEKLLGALARVDMTVEYDNVNDVFEIAALYALALACGHAFLDANKRTGLVTALAYLVMQGIDIPLELRLDDYMVDLTEHKLDYHQFGALLYTFANREEQAPSQ
ncbi:type II toxin-antitoxin system death-on-curing family toxin [Massilia rhizosphaerae]|uniref:type II toxin-antitoxin system death-on-curing family toxin n=1 Tax=Massilia rhizosphaerae TaxID=2784389 RepID=UPI0018DCF934|nr:type II toxin-antitoxin system death-on-curing family toxin [Massilia rhizosphaerae]